MLALLLQAWSACSTRCVGLQVQPCKDDEGEEFRTVLGCFEETHAGPMSLATGLPRG